MEKLKIINIKKYIPNNIVKVYDLTVSKLNNFLIKKENDKSFKLVHNTSLYPTIIYNTNLSVDTIKYLIPERIAIYWIYKRNEFRKNPEEFLVYDFEEDKTIKLSKEEGLLFLEKLTTEEFIFTEIGCIVYPPHIKEGLLRKVVNEPVKERKKIKPLMEEEEIKNGKTPLYLALFSEQYTYKVIANSVYGLAGFPKSRVFLVLVAAGITIHGRFLIKFMASNVNKFLRKIFKGDK